LLLFGKFGAIRRVFPMTRIDYIRVDGKEWVRDPDERFQSVDILGPLVKSIPRAISAILDDIPKGVSARARFGPAAGTPPDSRSAIREAVVNAVMHRGYRQKSSTQIIRYSNRLEIRNPGHSLKPDDRLGEPGSITRNEKIAGVLQDARYAETKGSGIRGDPRGHGAGQSQPADIRI
jgi:ATP-dependent DNA helicase RecG